MFLVSDPGWKETCNRIDTNALVQGRSHVIGFMEMGVLVYLVKYNNGKKGERCRGN